MHLAGAEHRVLVAAFAGGAADMARLAQIDGDGAGDAADHLAPADDAGDGLPRSCSSATRPRTRRGRDIARSSLSPTRCRTTSCRRRRCRTAFPSRPAAASVTCSARTGVTIPARRGCGRPSGPAPHRLHVGRPGIDEGDVLARPRHVRTGIGADGAGPTIAILWPMLRSPVVRAVCRGGGETQPAGRPGIL